VHHDGAAAENVLVAIADADWIWDDLIGVGPTAHDGDFQLSFTAAAFRQEALEREARPDVYVVLSVNHDGALIPIHRASFPGLEFGAGRPTWGRSCFRLVRRGMPSRGCRRPRAGTSLPSASS
jgi:hypothetical protein